MPASRNGEDEAQRVGVGGELAGFHQLEDHLLLALRVGVDADLGVGHLEVVERGARAAHARLARYHLLVDLGGVNRSGE